MGPEISETPLYDAALLKALDWDTVSNMKDGVTSDNPGSGFLVRPLHREDYDKGKTARVIINKVALYNIYSYNTHGYLYGQSISSFS